MKKTLYEESASLDGTHVTVRTAIVLAVLFLAWCLAPLYLRTPPSDGVGLEVLVLEGNMEARRRLILLVIAATLICLA